MRNNLDKIFQTPPIESRHKKADAFALVKRFVQRFVKSRHPSGRSSLSNLKTLYLSKKFTSVPRWTDGETADDSSMDKVSGPLEGRTFTYPEIVTMTVAKITNTVR
ncbi:hypothetical protein LF1_13000 [Rubripirellula obstinata]|uniref:Uncharacterized protein n=1 Tax=Rubripirellula obstinata TaxID=406547 RepID=A0A5B1CCB8_9BACT|nr:hypothetical protein LF1_13000 [Rubripirellula obstinata]